MPKQRRLIIPMALVLCAVLALYPPWQAENMYIIGPNGAITKTVPGRHWFVFAPPPEPELGYIREKQPQLDLTQLLLCWAAIGFIAVGAVLVMRRRPE